jgi:PD-(D/E)XK nuclease superfamily protein
VTRFAPVRWTADEALGDGVSATFLRHLNLCARSAFLYQRYKGQALTVEMQRGKLGHRALELATRTIIQNGERNIPPELAKAVLDEVIADPEYWCPIEHHDYVREAVYRWAAHTIMDPAYVVAVETLFELDVVAKCGYCGGRGKCIVKHRSVGLSVGGPDVAPCPVCDGDGFVTWRVRCRIDFAETSPDGRTVVVRDWKFGPGAPPLDEIARKREDGTFAAKNMQLILYALVLVYGVPVREEACARCAGTGWLCAHTDGPHDPIKGTCCEPTNDEFPLAGGGCPSANGCPDCLTKGRLEIREPFPVASRASQFDLEFAFPAIKTTDGDMMRRPLSLTRSELEPYLTSLEAVLGGLSYRVESGDWPAMVSDDACAICPASAECPIPREVRDHRGTVNTPEEAADAFEVREWEGKTSRARTAELRKFVEVHGPVRFGGGMVAELVPSVSQEIRDKDGMLAAMDVAVRFGEPFDRSQWVKEKVGSRLTVRALRQDEINGSEGSNVG